MTSTNCDVHARGLLALALAVVASKTPTGTTGIVISTTSLGADTPVSHTPGPNAPGVDSPCGDKLGAEIPRQTNRGGDIRPRETRSSSSTSWGAIMDEGKEVLDYSKTKKLIQSKFTMSVPNEEEKRKELLPHPKVDAVKSLSWMTTSSRK